MIKSRTTNHLLIVQIMSHVLAPYFAEDVFRSIDKLQEVK